MAWRYDALLHLPHPEPTRHQRMSPEARAAQFAPFAALTGYEAAVHETARLTDRRIELDDCQKAELNDRLRILQQRLAELPDVTITCFEPDTHKAGGAYRTLSGRLKRIDLYARQLILTDGYTVPIEQIYRIESSLIHGFD